MDNLQLKSNFVPMQEYRTTLQEEIENIKKEFPFDEALQEIHISRKILAYESKKNKMNYLEYIKQVAVGF